jgi:branched-chain amino acid transport system substrate-binding protein
MSRFIGAFSKRLEVTVAIAAALAFVGASSGRVLAQAKPPYALTAILPLTGNLAFVGAQQQKAIQGLETFTNSHGGINGRPLHVEFLDDGNNPATSVQLLGKVLPSQPAAIIGGGSGATCRALAALAKDGPVLYCLTPAVRPERGGYMYSTSVGYDDTIFATIRYLSQKGYRRFAYISTTDASGQQADIDIAEAMRKPENSHIEITAHEKMAIGDFSSAAQVQRMVNSKPDAIFALVTGNAVGTVLRELHDAGNTLPVATTIGNMTFAQMTAYRSFLPAVYLIPAPPWAGSADSVPPGPLRNAIKQYFEIIQSVGGRPDDIGGALAYDPMLIIIDALKHLPPDPTAMQVRGYISDLSNFAGSSGIYNFRLSSQRGLSIGDCIVVRWDPVANRYFAMSGPGGNALRKMAK